MKSTNAPRSTNIDSYKTSFVNEYFINSNPLLKRRLEHLYNQVISITRKKIWNIKNSLIYFLVKLLEVVIIKRKLTAQRRKQYHTSRPDVKRWAVLTLLVQKNCWETVVLLFVQDIYAKDTWYLNVLDPYVVVLVN